jgi:protein TonB
MRKYTLVFSIVAHALGVGAMIIVPALATDELPEPRRTDTWIVVDAVMPPPPPLAPVHKEVPPTPVATVPLTAPEGIQPEPLVEPVDPGFDPSTAPGGSIGDVVSSGDLVAPLPPPPPPRPKDPVRVGGRISPPTKLTHVNPIYPPIPLAAKKEGLVILEALIGEDGAVRDVRVLRSAPLFDEAAIIAVRQWRFSPTLLNGEPVPLVMTVTVGFTLER